LIRRRSGSSLQVGVVTAAAIFARVSTVVLIAFAARGLQRSDFDLLVYTLAVSAAVQILLDPGTASFVAIRWPEVAADQRDRLVSTGASLQVAVGCFIVAATMAIVHVAHAGRGAVAVGAGLGVLGAAEGVARYGRVSAQVEGRFPRFAAVDCLIGVGRFATAVPLIMHRSLGAFVAASAVWGIVLAVVSLRQGPRPRLDIRAVTRMVAAVWEYGASTFFSALYSQAPAVLLGLLGGLRQGALYAIVARITQPTELVPSAIASVFLPRLARETPPTRRNTFARQSRIAAAAGLVAMLGSVGVGSILLGPLGASGAILVLVIVVAVLPFKFLNYQLVSLALADGQVRRRLTASMTVAAICVISVCALAHRGAAPVATVVLACELLLFVLLTRVSRKMVLIARPLW
jgi:O-antigen/teichoic acid export membrane protein